MYQLQQQRGFNIIYIIVVKRYFIENFYTKLVYGYNKKKKNTSRVPFSI